MLGVTEITKVITNVSADKEKNEIDNMIKIIVSKYPGKIQSIIKALSRSKKYDGQEVTIITASDLTETKKEKIKISLETKERLNFIFKISTEIGGGIIIKKGELIIDNSTSNLINQIKNKILSTNLS